MRRSILYWYLPLAIGLLAAFVFATGFVMVLGGKVGEPVSLPTISKPAPAIPDGEIRTMIIGDSLARGTGDETGLGIAGRFDSELDRLKIKKQKTVSLAINGARTTDLLKQLEGANIRRLIGESNIVIVSIGGNDLFGDSESRDGAPPNPEKVMDTVMGRVEQAIKVVRDANPRARIFVIGLYNPFGGSEYGKLASVYVNRWNARLTGRFENDPNLTIVQTSDLFSHHDRLSFDRFHPGGEGYRLIARRIADSI